MISGAFSLSTDIGASEVINHFRNFISSGNSDIVEVIADNFVGSIFLHPGLPGTFEDFYFEDRENDILVLISGYIYNKSEICKEINVYEDITETELVAKTFLKWGTGFVDRLNGDFAIFIGQPSRHRAYLFRDHAGIRPLAYTISGPTLFFSSDILGLCRRFGDNSPVVDDFLLGYFKYVDYRKTPNGKVSKLLPGHCLEFSGNGIKIEKYWDPENIRTDHSLTRDRILTDLKSILWDAVRIRADQRFTAGAHVSSGLDSGIVSTLARSEYPYQRVFYGFSWSPENFDPGKIEFDEREIVRKSCKMADIQPVFTRVNLDEYISFLHQFEISKWFFSEVQVLNIASRLNTNLIFSGWGGDEFISIGDRGIDSDLIFGLKWCTFFMRYPLKHFKKLTKTLLYYVVLPALGMLDFPTKRSFKDDARYLKRKFKASDKNALRNFYFYTSRRHLHLGMFNFYHLQERCESWYVNGYRKGVEYRYPLLDKRIIEYMLKVPSEILADVVDYRIIIRKISEGILPEEVRSHWQKIDPVVFAQDKYYLKEAGMRLMGEAGDWKSNPHLHFINFHLLEKDIRRYRKNNGYKNSHVLFRALVYIKAIYEFTMKY